MSKMTKERLDEINQKSHTGQPEEYRELLAHALATVDSPQDILMAGINLSRKIAEVRFENEELGRKLDQMENETDASTTVEKSPQDNPALLKRFEELVRENLRLGEEIKKVQWEYNEWMRTRKPILEKISQLLKQLE